MPTSRLRAHRPPLQLFILILTFLGSVGASGPAFAMRNVGHVEVTSEASSIRTTRQIATSILATVAGGTILEVLDKEGDWYWILMDPDLTGIRRVGWVHEGDVVERPDLDVTAPSPIPEAQAQAQAEADHAMTPSMPDTVERPRVEDDTPLLMAVVLHFEFDSAELSVDGRGKLDEMVAQLGTGLSASIDIEGHTDSDGPTKYNEQLGLRRAEAVRQYLSERHQIPLDQMDIASFGEDAPIATNDTTEGRALNRRVVITF